MLLKRGGGEGAGRIQASRTWRVGPIQDTFAGCRVLPSHSSRDARVLFTSHSSTLMGTRNTVVCCYVSAFCNAIVAHNTWHISQTTSSSDLITTVAINVFFQNSLGRRTIQTNGPLLCCYYYFLHQLHHLLSFMFFSIFYHKIIWRVFKKHKSGPFFFMHSWYKFFL